MDQEEFYISPLSTKDVILGAPWFHRMAALLEFPSRNITFKYRNREICISTKDQGNTIPLVTHASICKSIKSNLFAYLIFASEKKDAMNDVDKELSLFLKSFKECFANELPSEIPPSRGEDDHKIDLIPGTSPPNRPPYRVSYAQQEEILTQVNELLEKGLIRPSSSPFCSPVLLVQKKDGSYRIVSTIVHLTSTRSRIVFRCHALKTYLIDCKVLRTIVDSILRVVITKSGLCLKISIRLRFVHSLDYMSMW